MLDPWAFGWNAVAALATSLAAIAALVAWRVDAHGRKADEADSVALEYATVTRETLAIFRTYTDPDGETVYVLADGRHAKLGQVGGLVGHSDYGDIPDKVLRISNMATVTNGSRFAIYDLLVDFEDVRGAREFYGDKAHPWMDQVLHPGETLRIPEDDAPMFAGFGIVAYFTMSGKRWVTKQGQPARRDRVNISARLKRLQRGAKRWRRRRQSAR